MRSIILALCVACTAREPAPPPPDRTDTGPLPDTAAAVDTDPAAVDTHDTDRGPPVAGFCGDPQGSIGGTPEPRAITSRDAAVGELTRTIEGLGWRLLAMAAPGNAAVSPTSVFAALGPIRDGASGQTRDELDALLGVGVDADLWRTTAASLFADVGGTSAGGDAQVRLASRLFGSEGVQWTPSWVATCATGWGSPLLPTAFAADPEAARLTINAWVSEQTCALVPELLPPGHIQADTKLVSVSALFAEADWRVPFEERGVIAFQTPDAAVFPPQIASEHVVAHGRRDNITVARLDLAGGELGFWLLMPDALDDLPVLESRLASDGLDPWTAVTVPLVTRVFLPRWSQRTASDLAAPLAALGAPTVFSPTEADLSGMSSVPLHLARVQHEAVLVVDAAGVRAAAATAAISETDSVGPEPVDLHIRRPFLWVLRDELTGLVLFAGRTLDPTGG